MLRKTPLSSSRTASKRLNRSPKGSKKVTSRRAFKQNQYSAIAKAQTSFRSSVLPSSKDYFENDWNHVFWNEQHRRQRKQQRQKSKRHCVMKRVIGGSAYTLASSDASSAMSQTECQAGTTTTAATTTKTTMLPTSERNNGNEEVSETQATTTSTAPKIKPPMPLTRYGSSNNTNNLVYPLPHANGSAFHRSSNTSNSPRTDSISTTVENTKIDRTPSILLLGDRPPRSSNTLGSSLSSSRGDSTCSSGNFSKGKKECSVLQFLPSIEKSSARDLVLSKKNDNATTQNREQSESCHHNDPDQQKQANVNNDIGPRKNSLIQSSSKSSKDSCGFDNVIKDDTNLIRVTCEKHVDCPHLHGNDLPVLVLRGREQ